EDEADDAAADIVFATRPPASIAEGEAVVIEGQMRGAKDVESAELFYRSAATGGWHNLEFELVAGDHYRVEIPADDVRPPLLEYYVVAVDFLENRHAALASEDHPVEIKVETGRGGKPGKGEHTAPATRPAKGAPAKKGKAVAGVAQESKPIATAQNREPLAALRTVTREEIQAMGARTLIDVLAAVPEVDAWRDSEGFDRVAIRGRGVDGDVLLRLDGQVLNNPYDGRANFRLPADLIDQVVIRRGGAAG